MGYNIPAELRYVDTDEWIRIEGSEVVIGITDYAQDALGDIVYIDLPKEGEHFALGDTFGVIESVKAAADLYAPVSGTVLAAHTELEDDQAVINKDPYGEGWMVRLKLSNEQELDKLLDAAAYEKLVEEKKQDH